QVVPEALGAALGQRVLDRDRTAQADHIVGAVAATDALPAGILVPVLLQALGFSLTCAHVGSAPYAMAFGKYSALSDSHRHRQKGGPRDGFDRSEQYKRSGAATSQISYIRANPNSLYIN